MIFSLSLKRTLVLFGALALLTSCGKKIVAESDRIRIFEPQSNAVVESPFMLRGEARTFESNVRFRLIDTVGNVLVDSNITARGELGEFGPFEVQVTFDAPSGDEGILEVFEESAEDGSEMGKVEIPVRF